MNRANLRAPLRMAQRCRAEADENDPTLERTAHFNVMFNRLMYDPDPYSGATLTIRNKETGKEVAKIGLSHILAQGRTAYEYGYPAQEYLDREHDYHLDFLLKGDKWQYCTVMIDILGWNKRMQNTELN